MDARHIPNAGGCSPYNLSLVANQKPKEVFDHFEHITETIKKGSIITQDNGIKTLAIVASANAAYNQAIFPFLMGQLETCRPKSVAQYAESINCALRPSNQEQYLQVLNQRLAALSPSQQSRVKKIIRTLGKS
jgi:hypothetical protein